MSFWYVDDWFFIPLFILYLFEWRIKTSYNNQLTFILIWKALNLNYQILKKLIQFNTLKSSLKYKLLIIIDNLSLINLLYHHMLDSFECFIRCLEQIFLIHCTVLVWVFLDLLRLDEVLAALCWIFCKKAFF